MRAITEIRSVAVEVLFAELTDFMVGRFERGTGSKEAGSVLRQNIELTLPEAIEQLERLRLFMPTQFLWSLVKGVFSVADPLKWHLAQNFPKYECDVETVCTWYSIKNLLEKYYPVECPYWELFGEGKFKEAQALLPRLKRYRKKFEDCFYVEVFCWGLNNAAFLHDEDCFFKTYSEARDEMPASGFLTNQERMIDTLSELLVERFKKGFRFKLTQKGISMVELNSRFLLNQQYLFLKFLLARIAYETCTTRSIRSGEGFRFFIEEGWDQLQGDYSKTNEYITFVECEQ